MTWQKVSQGNFGLGIAKVTIEIARADGTVDRVRFNQIKLSDREDSELVISEEEPEEVSMKELAVRMAPDQHVCLSLSGKMLRSNDVDKPLWSVELNVNKDKEND